MIQLVHMALRRPYTFVVMAILVVVYGAVTVRHMPTDVFPTIRMPVVSVVWVYDNLMPQGIEGRITYMFERLMTSTVEGIKEIRSRSQFGSSIVNVFLQKNVPIAKAEAEITAVAQTVINWLPPDISPPMVMRLSPSSVPVATLQVTADTLTPGELYNLAFMRIRPLLVSIEGAILPHPYGGTDMNIQISLDKHKVLARGLTPSDVHKALNHQALVFPSGAIKVGPTQWLVQTNTSPLRVEDFKDMPVKREGNAWVHMRDLGDVNLRGRVQKNAVLVDGQQAVTIVVMKSTEASTLDVVDGIKKMIPRIEEVVPEEVDVKLLHDASAFVRHAISEVVHEMVIAAALVGFIVLLLIGSWRPTLIVTTTIPLSILTSIVGLHLAGETINVMTLGGLALAVGILVDNAVVVIENIDRHMEMGKPLSEAIIDASKQIVLPTFVATLAIAIVWFPLFGLSGVSGWLFVPMAEAIIFAMLASFVLSFTLLPTMAKYILVAHNGSHAQEHGGRAEGKRLRAFFARFQQGFARRFEQFRDRYTALLEQVIAHRVRFVAISLALALVSLSLFFVQGREFFPEIRSDVLEMHMRAPMGTRIEVTGRIGSLVANDIKELLPGQVEDIVVNCGLPVGPHNLAFIPTPTIGSQDCDLTITLTNEESPVWEYRRILRKGLKERYPGTTFTFRPSDLTEKILNFGSPAPIDVQINGPDLYPNYEFARKLAGKLRKIPGAADVVVQQNMRRPTLRIENDRSFALGLNLTQEDAAKSTLITTAGSRQVDQNYWLDRQTGMSYAKNVRVPQRFLTSFNDLKIIPVEGAPEIGADSEGNHSKYNTVHNAPKLLGNTARLSMVGTGAQFAHLDIMPLFDIYVSNEGRDLGSVLADVEKVAQSMEAELPRGSVIDIRGQAETMDIAFDELLVGLIFAILLVYLLIVINFQSWLDPFIIITALPGALAGIAWILFLTYTNNSVSSLTGAVMTMGVATANSILVVAYARERFDAHGNALRAAIEAGRARFRPVLMTALAMIIGMLPMSMANSQNAPLGRAVIGGLVVATVFTLLFVPCVYAIIYNRRTVRQQGA